MHCRLRSQHPFPPAHNPARLHLRASPLHRPARARMASISATRALTQVLQTDEDVAALNALAPAVVRPAPDVADKLEYRDEDCSESVAGLSLSAFKITGLTETTFVWSNYWYSDMAGGCSMDVLYLLEGQDRRFQMLLHLPRDNMDDCDWDEDAQGPQAELHLNRFRGLRARLRTALPALAQVSDPTLLALLCAMGSSNGAEKVKLVAGHFAFTRLMKGHPQRRDSKPTEAERALAELCCDEDGEGGVPVDLGKRPGGDAMLVPRGIDFAEGYINVRGLCVPNGMDEGRLRAAVETVVGLLDSFHSAA